MDRSLDKLYENIYFRDAVSVILSIILAAFVKKWIDFINTFLAVHYTLMEHVSIDILNCVRE